MKSWLAAFALIPVLASCVTTGAYNKKWQPIDPAQAKISFAEVGNLGACLKVYAAATASIYNERHRCKGEAFEFAAYATFYTPKWILRAKNTRNAFKQDMKRIVRDDISIEFGDVKHMRTDFGDTQYAIVTLDDEKCFGFASRFGISGDDYKGRFRSKVRGFYCGPEVAQGLDIDAYNAALIVRDMFYDGTGIPPAALLPTKSADAGDGQG